MRASTGCFIIAQFTTKITCYCVYDNMYYVLYYLLVNIPHKGRPYWNGFPVHFECVLFLSNACSLTHRMKRTITRTTSDWGDCARDACEIRIPLIYMLHMFIFTSSLLRQCNDKIITSSFFRDKIEFGRELVKKPYNCRSENLMSFSSRYIVQK